jgi:DNA-binding SARP family transcriptional activator
MAVQRSIEEPSVSPHRVIRIRLLGPLEVERLDGVAVGWHEWRTGKTMDLLRILALNSGRPVRMSSVIDKLWPQVGWDRARASVRTAASDIRRAVGANCIARQNEHLLLRGAWVDAIRYREVARFAHLAAKSGQHARVVHLTSAAERLYRGNFHAHNDESPWARAERDHLLRTRRAMLCEAADAAILLGKHDDAVDFAESAIRIDPTSEAAHRALMRSYAGLGEIANALRAFEAYRSHLAEELGADPSPQTRELHLRLLRGEGA